MSINFYSIRSFSLQAESVGRVRLSPATWWNITWWMPTRPSLGWGFAGLVASLVVNNIGWKGKAIQSDIQIECWSPLMSSLFFPCSKQLQMWLKKNDYDKANKDRPLGLVCPFPVHSFSQRKILRRIVSAQRRCDQTNHNNQTCPIF